MNIQHFLTLSIDAIALSFAAMMVIDLAYSLSKAWCKSSNPELSRVLAEGILPPPNSRSICAATLAPIFESIPEQTIVGNSTHLVGFSIRELKKQASVAKIKNYNVMTKAQLIQALSA